VTGGIVHADGDVLWLGEQEGRGDQENKDQNPFGAPFSSHFFFLLTPSSVLLVSSSLLLS
jgi:hypothetical protein